MAPVLQSRQNLLILAVQILSGHFSSYHFSETKLTMDIRSIFYSDENCLELGKTTTSVKLILSFHENIAIILSYHLCL